MIHWHKENCSISVHEMLKKVLKTFFQLFWVRSVVGLCFQRLFLWEREQHSPILKIPLCRLMPVFWNPGYHFYQTEGWNRFNPFSFIKRGNTHNHVHKHTHTHTHKPIFTTISHLLVFYNVTHLSKEFI